MVRVSYIFFLLLLPVALFSHANDSGKSDIGRVVELKAALSEYSFCYGDTVKLTLSYKNTSADGLTLYYPDFVFLMEVIDPIVFRGGMLKVIRHQHPSTKLLIVGPYGSTDIHLKFIVDPDSFYMGERSVYIVACHYFPKSRSNKKAKSETDKIYDGVLHSNEFMVNVKETVTLPTK
ncbi:MAG: hypothetical protein ACK5HT_09885 [Draconibacterium sp.]